MDKVVTLAELYQMGRDAYDSLWEQARSLNRDVKLYLHWTAGHHSTVFPSYHVNITGDGAIHVTGDLDEVKSHTWRRNTGAIGITLDCCVGATSDDLGDEAPTQVQIEVMAQVIAVLADALDLSIDIQRVMTHGEAADNLDDYWGAYGADELYGPQNGCERWDLAILTNDDEWCSGGDTLRGKANWYRNEWKNSGNPPYAPAQ